MAGWAGEVDCSSVKTETDWATVPGVVIKDSNVVCGLVECDSVTGRSLEVNTVDW